MTFFIHLHIYCSVPAPSIPLGPFYFAFLIQSKFVCFSAASYDVIASTLKEKLHVPAEQFKAYFLALLADQDFSRVIETVSEVDKPLRRSMPYHTQTRIGRLTYQQPYFRPYQRPPQRVNCYRSGEPGHKSPQCWKRAPSSQPSSFVPAQPRPPRPST